MNISIHIKIVLEESSALHSASADVNGEKQAKQKGASSAKTRKRFAKALDYAVKMYPIVVAFTELLEKFTS